VLSPNLRRRKTGIGTTIRWAQLISFRTAAVQWGMTKESFLAALSKAREMALNDDACGYLCPHNLVGRFSL